MKYYTVEEFGNFDGFRLKEKNKPDYIEPEQVVVKVRAASLNYKDLALIMGMIPVNNDSEYVPLSDGAGEVVLVGSNVKQFKVGDRVVTNYFPDWFDGKPSANMLSLGREMTGMLSEYIVLPASALSKFPDYLSYQEASTLPCAGLTAWNALTKYRKIDDFDTVLTLGTGGVSLFAIQIAKSLGKKVISTTGSNSKRSILESLGADHILNYKETENWDNEVMKLTHGRGVDQVVEVGGATTFQKSLNSLAFNGHISAVGVVGGLDGGFNPNDIIFKSAQINGVFVGSHTDFHEFLEFCSSNKIRPIIDSQKMTVHNIKKAFERLASQQHVGKIVIDFDE